MMQIRRATERGHFNHGWLDTFHTFSFGGYQDRRYMGFRVLRVMNEDRVEPGEGFGMHAHHDMEIITYVLEGALEHRDSLGNGEVLRPGEFQRMSAGTGIMHSEFNPSDAEPVHLYQIWLLPQERGLEPSYEQKAFPEDERHNRLRLVASPDGREGSLIIHQDASVFLGSLDAGSVVTPSFGPNRYGWLQVLRGMARVDDEELAAGDGAAISDAPGVVVHALQPAEVMLFDLP